MADRHTIIQTQVITDWSVQKRGRLYICTQGKFRHLHNDGVITVSPYPKKNPGFPDLFGFEYVSKVMHDFTCMIAPDDYHTEILPIFCLIEVKTKVYSKLTDEQINHLNYCVQIGGHAYVAREADCAAGYVLEQWTLE